MAAETNTVRQYEDPCLEKLKFMVLFVYFLIKKIIPEIVPLWLKIEINELIQEGLYKRDLYVE